MPNDPIPAVRNPKNLTAIQPCLLLTPVQLDNNRIDQSGQPKSVLGNTGCEWSDKAHTREFAVFVDIDYLERNELYALRQIRQTLPRASIIAYSSKDHSTFAASCHIAGANALLSKHVDEEHLITAIRRTMDEGYFTDDKSLLTLLERT